MYVSQLKKNLSYFSFLSYTLSLCFTTKEKSSYFSLLSHALSLCLEGGNTSLSPPWLSHRRRQYSLLSPPWLSPRMWQSFTLSFLSISSKVATLCSLLLTYLLEGNNPLLSSPSCIPPKQKSFFFSLLISRSIFPLSIGRILGPKPSNSLYLCLFIRLFFLFPLELRIHYFFFNKEQTFLPHQIIVFPSTQRKPKLIFPSSTRKPN